MQAAKCHMAQLRAGVPHSCAQYMRAAKSVYHSQHGPPTARQHMMHHHTCWSWADSCAEAEASSSARGAFGALPLPL